MILTHPVERSKATSRRRPASRSRPVRPVDAAATAPADRSPTSQSPRPACLPPRGSRPPMQSMMPVAADIARGVAMRVVLPARDQQERAGSVRVGQRHQQPAVALGQRVQPRQRQMRHAGIDDDGIGRPLRAVREAVRRDHIGLRPAECQVRARPRGKRRIDLHRGDRALATDDVGEDRAVVAGADADMHHVLTRGEIKLVIQERPKARLAVVQPARLVDRDQHVVVEVARIGIFRGPVVPQVPWAQQAPRTRSGEVFARHGREGAHDRWRSHARHMPQLLGEPAPRGGDVVLGHPKLLTT